MRKIAVITGSRADYGLLSGLMRKISLHPALQLQVVATNMHLLEVYGYTYREIESDGFIIDWKVMLPAGNETPKDTAIAVAEAVGGFASAFEALKPDMIVLLGDRYETLAAATAALFFRIPVAHLHGGEITQGAYDDAMRHAITKLSHLHFTATEEYRQRVIQMGEQPQYVFNVGALGVENTHLVERISKRDLEEWLDFEMGEQCLMVTYHPETLGNLSSQIQVEALLKALDKFPLYNVIFTLPNSDTQSTPIREQLIDYGKRHPERCVVKPSLGMRRYLSALSYVDAVVGNSSSGIIEVPSFGIPTLNIGDRQAGRAAAASVVHCGVSEDEISDALSYVLSREMREKAKTVSNPYDKPGTADAIVRVLATQSLDTLIQKTFYDSEK